MDTNTVIAVTSLTVSVITGLGVLYLNFKKAPGEMEQTTSDAADKALDAADKALGLNTRYIARIESLEGRNKDLEQRVLRVESPQKYQIVVEFETSAPPRVGKVSITPTASDSV